MEDAIHGEHCFRHGICAGNPDRSRRSGLGRQMETFRIYDNALRLRWKRG